ncbi:L-lactate dehydrogenase [Ruminococcus sp. HUN007]|jgi:L-lactate dehydrogenase|uniref:L-lactate dehydrogenase n=1 Tax=Ruminococcus sp. HUN007 TaxID=1514668 RepID=UPI0005D1CA7D|nr:L-lactate dehydrogenase [Ruminococcus sp. HUN007]
MNKISIIGAGSVGSTIAYTLTIQGIASEIVLIDINTDKAEGEALDIIQGTPFSSPCNIYQGSYDDAKDSDIVILTSGIARKPGQSRLELAQTNVNITKSIIPEIVKSAPNAFYIIVSNPIDVLTYTFCKLSGLPENRIIGSGTTIDSSRLRAKLSDCYDVSQNNIHAYVFGEHGDSSFVPWSLANIAGVPMNECAKFFGKDEIVYDEVEEFVRTSGAQVIKRKGATFYAIAVSVCHICERILHGIDTVLPVSTMMNGEYGVSDVCLSTLNLVGKEGVRKVNVPLTDEEQAKLQKSAEALKEVIKNLDI